MSHTPRTDAAAIRCACSTYVVTSEFARELERENVALRAALDSLCNKIAGAAKGDCRKLHDFERIALAIKEAKND